MGFRWFSLTIFGGCEQVLQHSPNKVRVLLALSGILVILANSILLGRCIPIIGFSALARRGVLFTASHAVYFAGRAVVARRSLTQGRC